MAGLTNNGTKNLLPEAILPSGYSRPSVTTFSDDEYQSIEKTIEVSKASVENATASTTMSNLVVAITAAVTALLTADFAVATATVTAFTEFLAVRTNLRHDEDLFKNIAPKYICSVKIYVKTA